MNRYMKLVHMEISRFWKLYVVLFAVTLLVQCGGVLMAARDYMSRRQHILETELLTDAQYVVKHGAFNLYTAMMDASMWIVAPIALSAVTLLLYTVFIWYREWMGKNSFIYRLLMLPTARRNIYLAKLTAILLLVLGLVGFQLAILPIEQLICRMSVPQALSDPVSLLEMIRYYYIFVVLVPNHLTDFLLLYGTGTALVILLFTIVLLERSYRLKGIIAGILYLIVVSLILIAPLYLYDYQTSFLHFDLYLYPMESLTIEMVLILIIGLISLWISLYLLQKKVTV
ncbi:hypothetical protein ACFPYJ_21645 [Paenibacillus solisilvae]|uniref:ABC transporter permease n=1 Tax=Paenibacillus solisilvae TaxID=2486751 RepID=A0ABW0W5L5_9BACL